MKSSDADPRHYTPVVTRPPKGLFVTRRFYEKYPKWSAVGKTIWDGQRCLADLQSLRFVNANRLGCMEHSLGTHSAVFLATVDEGVRCVVSNYGLSSFRCNPN